MRRLVSGLLKKLSPYVSFRRTLRPILVWCLTKAGTLKLEYEKGRNYKNAEH